MSHTACNSSAAIITARHRLMNLARELQQGIEPFPASHGDIYRVRDVDVNTAIDDFNAEIGSHGSGLVAKVGGVASVNHPNESQPSEVHAATGRPGAIQIAYLPVCSMWRHLWFSFSPVFDYR